MKASVLSFLEKLVGHAGFTTGTWSPAFLLFEFFSQCNI